MVIISTRAVDVSIQALSPELMNAAGLGAAAAGAAAGAGAVAAGVAAGAGAAAGAAAAGALAVCAQALPGPAKAAMDNARMARNFFMSMTFL
jgi:hypothetical protein